MSLILDTLRKMEQDRKARRPGDTDIRPEVLSYRGVPRTSSPPSLLIPVTAGLILLVLCSGGWFLLKEDTPVPTASVKDTSARTILSPEPARPVPSAPPQATVAPTAPQTLPLSATVQQPATPPPHKEQKSYPLTEVSTAAGITISGIAYQDERTLRRAVINGSLVGEGAEIAGVRVIEIRENRIRFARGSETFDLVYSSGVSDR